MDAAGCTYSSLRSEKCRTGEDGKVVCETTSEQFRKCPGKGWEKKYFDGEWKPSKDGPSRTREFGNFGGFDFGGFEKRLEPLERLGPSMFNNFFDDFKIPFPRIRQKRDHPFADLPTWADRVSIPRDELKQLRAAKKELEKIKSGRLPPSAGPKSTSGKSTAVETLGEI
jgi:hypothetical protein